MASNGRLAMGRIAYSKRNLTNFIKGAQEAANAQLDAADMDNVGVVALDDTTFQITLASPCPFFERVLTEKTTAPVRPVLRRSMRAHGL